MLAAGGTRHSPESGEAKAPQQDTGSDHAATSLATLPKTQAAGTNFHRVLAWPVGEALRCAPAAIDLSLPRDVPSHLSTWERNVCLFGSFLNFININFTDFSEKLFCCSVYSVIHTSPSNTGLYGT